MTELQHYGTRGMRWGFRKVQPSGGSSDPDNPESPDNPITGKSTYSKVLANKSSKMTDDEVALVNEKLQERVRMMRLAKEYDELLTNSKKKPGAQDSKPQQKPPNKYADVALKIGIPIAQKIIMTAVTNKIAGGSMKPRSSSPSMSTSPSMRTSPVSLPKNSGINLATGLNTKANPGFSSVASSVITKMSNKSL